MRTIFEFIEFSQELSPKEAKTKRWSCKNRKHGDELGIVRWYGQWRQYCYFPLADIVYSAGCMRNIAEFVQEANDIHRLNKAQQELNRIQAEGCP